MNKNYYIDMDGVMAKYDRSAYIGDNPRWLRKNEHYFLNLEPDRKVLELMDTIYKNCRYTGNELFILTSLPMNGAIFNEHFHDKIAYIHKWADYIDIDHILISVTSKRDAVEYINNHTLTKNDILIDDYNKNLIDWDLAGGTSVKYFNGINSKNSFNGIHLYHEEQITTMMEKLNNINEM